MKEFWSFIQLIFTAIGGCLAGFLAAVMVCCMHLSPLWCKIKCGDCGSWYGSKVWHSNSKYRKTIWQCNHKFDGGKKCTTPHLDEETIKKLFIKAVNILLTEKDEIIENFNAIKDSLFDTQPLETERLQL